MAASPAFVEDSWSELDEENAVVKREPAVVRDSRACGTCHPSDRRVRLCPPPDRRVDSDGDISTGLTLKLALLYAVGE